MAVKLFDSELNVMHVLWQEGPTTARHIADLLADSVGWNVNTTYTIIKRCIKKGAIERTEPHFQCRALISQEEIQSDETDELIDRIYGGAADKLFASLLSRKKLTSDQIQELRALIDQLE